MIEGPDILCNLAAEWKAFLEGENISSRDRLAMFFHSSEDFEKLWALPDAPASNEGDDVRINLRMMYSACWRYVTVPYV